MRVKLTKYSIVLCRQAAITNNLLVLHDMNGGKIVVDCQSNKNAEYAFNMLHGFGYVDLSSYKVKS